MQSKPWDLLAVVPSPTARHLLRHVFSLDTHCLDQAEHHEPHEKSGAHLFWILSGHGTLQSRWETVIARAGQRGLAGGHDEGMDLRAFGGPAIGQAGHPPRPSGLGEVAESV